VTLLLDVANADQKTLGRVQEAVRSALKADGRLKFIAFQALLERPKGSLKRIRKGIALLEEAQEDMGKLETAAAIGKLEKAVQLFEFSFLGLIRMKSKTQPLADALRLLAAAYFQDGQAKKAQETVQRLLVLAPKTRYKPDLFPKQMAQLVDDERLLFDEVGTSTVEITTDPPGARVYLNGRRVGRGPVKLEGVSRGFHYLTARMPGYKTTTMGLEVDPPKLARVSVQLKRFKRDPAPDMAKSFLEMGKGRPGPGLTGLASRLTIDMLVIGKAEPDQDLGRITLYLYDFRLKELLKGPVTASVSLDFPKAKVLEAVRVLFAGVPLDGKRPEPPKKVKPSVWAGIRRGLSTFRRSKGFWPTVGSVAGAVLTGVVVGLAVGLQPRSQVDPRGWRHTVLGHSFRF
jgi:hypothetical protein